jgi:GTP cyclohydrolase FolE2
MSQRDKRSISLPPALAAAIDLEAARQGTTMSAWIAKAAAHQLRLEAGRQGIAEWERENGPFTEAELAEARKTMAMLLEQKPEKRKRAA